MALSRKTINTVLLAIALCIPAHGSLLSLTPLKSAAVSSFTPASIAGLTRWYDSTDTSKVTCSGGVATTFAGEIGTEPNFVATGTERPTCATNVINGRAGLSFNGSSNRMHTDTAPQAFSYDTDFSVCVVHELTGNLAGFPTIWGAANAVPNKTIEWAYSDSPTFMDLYFGNSTGTHAAKITTLSPSVLNVWRLMCVVNSGGTTLFYINGASVAAAALATAGGAASTGDFLGSWISASDFFQGYIEEAFVYGGTALNSGNMSDLYTKYVTPKYAF